MNAAFLNLVDIHEVEPYSDAQDSECFDELARILHEYTAEERFVVTLLHTHFNVEDSEILMEFTDLKQRRHYIEPVPEKDFSADRIRPTSWRLNPDAQVLPGCRRPLQFEELDDIDAKYDPMDASLFRELALALAKHNKLNRFGIAIRDIPFPLGPNESLLETTFAEPRQLLVEPNPNDSESQIRAIETSWTLRHQKHIDPTMGCKRDFDMSCDRVCLTKCTWSDDLGGGKYHKDTHRGTQKHYERKNSYHRSSR